MKYHLSEQAIQVIVISPKAFNEFEFCVKPVI